MKYVVISGEITPKAFDTFLRAFRKADKNPGNVTVYIMSEGGDLDSGIGMYEILRTSQNKITTIGIGTVCSIATLLLMAGDHRILTEGSTVLIHDGDVGFESPLIKAKYKIDQYMNCHLWYCQQIAARSGKHLDAILEMAGRETYLNATQALNYGLIDEIRPYRPMKTEESNGSET